MQRRPPDPVPLPCQACRCPAAPFCVPAATPPCHDARARPCQVARAACGLAEISRCHIMESAGALRRPPPPNRIHPVPLAPFACSKLQAMDIYPFEEQWAAHDPPNGGDGRQKGGPSGPPPGGPAVPSPGHAGRPIDICRACFCHYCPFSSPCRPATQAVSAKDQHEPAPLLVANRRPGSHAASRQAAAIRTRLAPHGGALAGAAGSGITGLDPAGMRLCAGV